MVTSSRLIENHFHLGAPHMVQDLQTLTTQLSQHGYKLTRQRRAVVDVVGQGDTRLSAADIFTKAQRACPDLGLTTVYRTLDILVDLGGIRRVHLDDGCEAFAPTTVEHGHYLICSSCQTTIEFEDCNLNELLNQVADRTGFLIEQHWLELVGICPTCQETAHNN
jgi:Fur family ferric uptake transcriptional regulator